MSKENQVLEPEKTELTEEERPEPATPKHGGFCEEDFRKTFPVKWEPLEESPSEIYRPTPQETAAVSQNRGDDFISGYARYADVLEAPRLMHEAVGIQLLATVLNRNGVTIRLGSLSYSLDLWQVLLSGSGVGRSTLIGLADPIIQQAGMQDLERNARWGSPQALYQEMAEHPSGLYVWGEMSERLKLLNEYRFTGAKEWITDRYDNLKTPASITYRKTGKKNGGTPPIIFRCPPRINILATSSEEWFFNNLLQEDSAGGFVPRWMLIRAPDSGKIVPIPKRRDPDLAETLAIQLLYVSELRGEADLSLVLSSYINWYRSTHGRFKSQPNQALAMAYFNRHRGHVLKVAVVYEVSSSGTLRVSQSSWDRAVEMAKFLEETIFSLLPTGMSGRGYAITQMADRVRQAGADGLKLSELTRAFQHRDPRERDSHLSTLLQTEELFKFQRQTAGRTAKILVHKEFTDRYKERHAEGKPIT